MLNHPSICLDKEERRVEQDKMNRRRKRSG